MLRIVGLALVFVLLWALFAGESGASGIGTRYVVRPGDTLWSIATHHVGGDPREAVWEIREVNGLTTSSIRVGQTLVLPA